MASEKRERIRRYAATEEDERMLARLFDKYEAAQRRNCVQTTRFLSLHEGLTAEKAIRGEKLLPGLLWGGFEGAERRLALFYPEYMTQEEALAQSGVCFVRAAYREGTVTHRDMLGRLMTLGITRECLGDLLVHDTFCDILCLEETAPVILNELSRAGRETLRLSRPEGPPAPEEKKFCLVRDTVASLRLDAVVAAGCSVSRGTALEWIRAGKVKLNDLECLKPDAAVAGGDLISVRGSGRLQLAAVGGLSRKGRIALEIKKFL